MIRLHHAVSRVSMHSRHQEAWRENLAVAGSFLSLALAGSAVAWNTRNTASSSLEKSERRETAVQPLATMAYATSGLDPRVTFSHSTQHEATIDSVPRPEPYSVSVRAIKGGRVTMEDEYFIGNGGRFIAVMDGHGGGGVSDYLKRNLYETVQENLKASHGNSSNDNNMYDYIHALKSAFSQLEREVLAEDKFGYQGSTAVAVQIYENSQGDRTLISANVGDSRAVLSRKGGPLNLTRDHKPNDEKEKARILSMGEDIEWDRYSKVHRVCNLSLSRAIGDRYAKPAVSGEVEIQRFPVTKDDEFIILASDGLWDAMTSAEAVQFVHDRLRTELARPHVAENTKNYEFVLKRNMAKFVAREALKRGSEDNICVVIVWLKK